MAALLLFVPLVYAAISDFRAMIVPNWISLAIVAGFVVFVAASWPQIDLQMHLVIGAVFFGISLVCWFAGWLGGGDVKLLGAVGVWLGTQLSFAFLFLLAVLSAVMAGGLLLLRLYVRRGGLSDPKFPPLRRVAEMAEGGQFAYAVPIVLAGLLTLPRLFF